MAYTKMSLPKGISAQDLDALMPDDFKKILTPPDKPKCGIRTVLRMSSVETGFHDFLDRYGGQEVKVIFIDDWARMTVVRLHGDEKAVPSSWIKTLPVHDFPNTGAQRSWCNACGCVAHFNWRTGAYEAA